MSSPPSVSTSAAAAQSSSIAATKQIKTMKDVGVFRKSSAYHDLLAFLHSVNDAIKGRPTNAAVPQSDGVAMMLGLLKVAQKFIEQHPPAVAMDQRFGNKSFRDWYATLQRNAKDLLSVLTQNAPDGPDYAEMLMPYLLDAFGNATRIDYGSGHELAFVILLLCLQKIGVFTPEDTPALGLVVFAEYLRVVRSLQKTYRMEPAGSRGFNCLDDFQFLPFLWGASQMIHTGIPPNDYAYPERVMGHEDLSLFYEALAYINDTKCGPFSEHSSMLWNTSAVETWEKINSGLFKMYEHEVLSKFPVMQHVYFCDLFSLTPFDD